jgi:hypothetical protein
LKQARHLVSRLFLNEGARSSLPQYRQTSFSPEVFLDAGFARLAGFCFFGFDELALFNWSSESTGASADSPTVASTLPKFNWAGDAVRSVGAGVDVGVGVGVIFGVAVSNLSAQT